jgi:hypothetical protein
MIAAGLPIPGSSEPVRDGVGAGQPGALDRLWTGSGPRGRGGIPPASADDRSLASPVALIPYGVW